MQIACQWLNIIVYSILIPLTQKIKIYCNKRELKKEYHIRKAPLPCPKKKKKKRNEKYHKHNNDSKKIQSIEFRKIKGTRSPLRIIWSF
ncbi:hypothetical protein ACJW30_06G029600 [Castanea mollissima]